VIIDTSALLAYFDTDEPDRQAVAAVLDDTDEPLVVSPYVVAVTLDHRHFDVLRPLTGGRFTILP
jgi:predicted nucleic acid-binding protein